MIKVNNICLAQVFSTRFLFLGGSIHSFTSLRRLGEEKKGSFQSTIRGVTTSVCLRKEGTSVNILFSVICHRKPKRCTPLFRLLTQKTFLPLDDPYPTWWLLSRRACRRPCMPEDVRWAHGLLPQWPSSSAILAENSFPTVKGFPARSEIISRKGNL